LRRCRCEQDLTIKEVRLDRKERFQERLAPRSKFPHEPEVRVCVWSNSSSFLLLFFVWQSPQQDTLRQHYEAAETRRLEGKLDARKLNIRNSGRGYGRLGKSTPPQGKFKEAISALEDTVLYRPNSQEPQIELAIAYFGAEQYQKGIEPLRKVLAGNPKTLALTHAGQDLFHAR